MVDGDLNMLDKAKIMDCSKRRRKTNHQHHGENDRLFWLGCL